MKVLHHALLALAALALLPACDLTGEEGNLSFRDTSIGEFEIDRAVGVGSTIVIEVSCASCDGRSLSMATSDDPSVLEVVSFSGASITCRGVAAGSTMIHARMAGLDDRIAVDVAPIADATIRLEPWPDFAPLPPSLWADGAAILAGESMEARGFANGSDGERLTGFGGIDWQLDGGGELEFAADRRSDSILITAPAEPGSTLELIPSVGETQRAQVIEEWEVSSLRLAQLTDGDPRLLDDGGSLNVVSGEALVLQLVAYTTDGLYVIGAGEDIATIEIDAALDGIVAETGDSLADESEADQAAAIAEVRREFERGFLLSSTDGLTGGGELTFSWLGQSLSVELTVVAPE